MAAETKRAVLAALVGNGLISISKLAVGIISGSVAMLSEAAHSFADTFNQVFLLVGLKLGEKPDDVTHPFGHGKERFFWTFVTALMMFFVGAFFSLYEGINVIIEALGGGHQPTDSAVLPIYLTLAVAMIFETGSLTVAIRELVRAAKKENRGVLKHIRETEDTTLKTVLFEDTAAIAGIIIAFAGILLANMMDNRIYDGAASVMIGLILAAVAIFLAAESRTLLLGQAASLPKREKLFKIISEWPSVLRVHDLLTMHIGTDRLLLTADIEFVDQLSTEEIENQISDLEQAILKEMPEVKKSFIEPHSPRQKD